MPSTASLHLYTTVNRYLASEWLSESIHHRQYMPDIFQISQPRKQHQHIITSSNVQKVTWTSPFAFPILRQLSIENQILTDSGVSGKSCIASLLPLVGQVPMTKPPAMLSLNSWASRGCRRQQHMWPGQHVTSLWGAFCCQKNGWLMVADNFVASLYRCA